MTKGDRRIVTPGPDPRDREDFKEEAARRCAPPRGANRATKRREEVQPRTKRRNEGWRAANLEALPFLKKKRKAIAVAHGFGKHTHAHGEKEAVAKA